MGKFLVGEMDAQFLLTIMLLSLGELYDTLTYGLGWQNTILIRSQSFSLTKLSQKGKTEAYGKCVDAGGQR